MVPGSSKVKVHIFHSGYCVAHGKVIDPVNGQKHCRVYATWALIEHPEQGLILFDTGYAPRFRSATAHWPYRLYALLTPMFLETHEPAVERLKALGYVPDQIKSIIISHFHGDHIAGLQDFPNAQVFCSVSAWAQANKVKGWAAVSKGVLPELIPADLEQRIYCIADSELGQLSNADSAYDLFGDGSMLLYALPGHGRGQLGALLHTPEGPVFLAADAAWQLEPWRAGILPKSIVRLFFDDWEAYKRTFGELRDFAQLHPDVRIVFTHSPELIEF
ncbi:MBL fold metallo-hydrolase [Haliscomenobacter sp.]|uniref:MBL fold metallo-hydrolase n=1 Tax=Haliscomenobacter sp. TaxID=2717303 RepID=UPI003BA95580